MRLLRATILPLLALLSLAALAWGVVSWWTFYRDLYVEEELALQALADESGGIRYRRAGDFEPLGRKRAAAKTGALPPIDVPWSVPFVHRVEYVDANDVDPMGYVQNSGPSSPTARDRALSLPGLRGYHEVALNSDKPSGVPATELPLGRPLPDLPEAKLTDTELDEAVERFPEGEALDAEESRALAQAIAERWSSTSSEHPRLTRRLVFEKPAEKEATTYEEVTLTDGERRLWLALAPPERSYRRDWRANGVLIDDEALWEFQVASGSRALRRVARLDLAEAETPPFWSSTALSVPEEFRHQFGPETWLHDCLIGESGRRIARVGRIDPQRLALEAHDDLRQDESLFQRRFRAVVREDLDFAIERWEFRSFYSGLTRPDPELRLKEVEIRRLASIGGAPCVVESYLDRWENASTMFGDELRLSRKRTLVATEVDPVFSSAAFEPISYVGNVPEPRELPLLRGYRVAWVAGGLGCLVAGIGFLIQALHRRRSTSREAPSSRRRSRLRFGLTSVVAATLLVIGVSGWIKARLDETEEESTLLRDLLADNVVQFQRAEPGFLWQFVSTDTLPIGAPLTSIELGMPTTPELLGRVLERSPAIRFAIDEEALNDLEPATEVAESALARSLPKFDDGFDAFEWDIERGQPLPDAEAKRLLEDIRAAWAETNAKRPTRFLLRVLSTLRGADEEGREEATFRDGERSWALQDYEIRTFDGRFHRRFLKPYDDGWLLVGRQAADEPLAAADYYLAMPDIEHRFEIGAPAFPLEYPVAPFAVPRELQSYWKRFEYELDRDDAPVAIERLDENRFLVEVARRREEGDATRSSPSDRWTVVVRRDFDWCAEAFDFVEIEIRSEEDELWANDPYANPGSDSQKGERALPARLDPIAFEHAVRCRTSLRRIDDRVFPVRTRIALFDDATGLDTRLRQDEILAALDLRPDLDERLFSRATLDAPDPTLPQERTWFAWYGVTFVLGVAIFAVGPLRATARRLRLTRPKQTVAAIDNLGKESA